MQYLELGQIYFFFFRIFISWNWNLLVFVPLFLLSIDKLLHMSGQMIHRHLLGLLHYSQWCLLTMLVLTRLKEVMLPTICQYTHMND